MLIIAFDTQKVNQKCFQDCSNEGSGGATPKKWS